MNARNRLSAAAAGGAVLVVATLVLLADRKPHAPTAVANGRDAVGRDAARVPATTPRSTSRAKYAQANETNAAATVAQAAAVSEGTTIKARALLGRIQAALGPTPELPGDLQRDLLEFLSAGEENRTALFSMVWEPGTPRMVLGHLRVFLAGLKDEEARRTLLAAFDAFDPHAAERAAVAARTKDPSLFVASLRACTSAKEKVDLMKKIPKDAWSDPAIAAWLLESASRDADEDVRGNAYIYLGFSKNAAAGPVIAAAVADAGRSVTERKRAAFALEQIPGSVALDELFRVYETAPDEVRRNLLPSIAAAPANRRVDDLLVEVLSGTETSEKTLKAAACAIDSRLRTLTVEETRDLGNRTAEAVKTLDSQRAVVALNSLGVAVVNCQPLREAVKDLERTAPAGGAIQVALVNIPSLRFALGRN